MSTLIDYNTNYYELLEVDQKADCDAVKKAYRHKALELHPDKLPAHERTKDAEEAFEQIVIAKDLLCDACQKAKYDAHIRDAPVASNIPKNHDFKTDTPAPDPHLEEFVQHVENIFAEKMPIKENGPTQADNDISKPEMHRSIQDNSYLIRTLIYNQTRLAEAMIRTCCDSINTPNSLGFSPLHYAGLFGYTDIATLLVEFGAGVTQNIFGQTPLHLSLESAHIQTSIALLIASGADRLNIPDIHGVTPTNLASDICAAVVISDITECAELMGLLA